MTDRIIYWLWESYQCECIKK